MASGVAMLLLTPPHDSSEPFEPSAGAIDRENGAALTELIQFSGQQHVSGGTPISNSSMALDGMDEDSDIEDRTEYQDIPDDDQDMPDGWADTSPGALLVVEFFTAQELPAEMDMAHSGLGTLYPAALEQTTGHGDLGTTTVNPLDEMSLFHPSLTVEMDSLDSEPESIQNTHYETQMDYQPPIFFSDSFQQDTTNISDEQNDTMEDDLIEGMVSSLSTSVSAFPEVISELSQQLQHIQDGQDHTDFTGISDAILDNMEDQFNLSLGDFLHAWGRTMLREEEPRRRIRGPSLPSLSQQRDLRDLSPMEHGDLQGEACDIQRIDWVDLGISRVEARDMRRHTYKNYTNLRVSHRPIRNANIPRLVAHHDFFKFRRMDFDHDVHLSHFQLRNLLACTSRDHIFYAGRSKVMHYSRMDGSGLSEHYSVAMDLTHPNMQPFYGIPGGAVQISTLTVDHNILVAGGFCGEYGITNLRAQKGTKHAEGIITEDNNAITNHVQVHLSRGSSLPLAAFASNDKGVRILDVNTNQFIAHHHYEQAINCTAISPDQRLRVLTADTRKVMICNAETGEIVQELDGHKDFGFACDWADDGWTVATGNQDMQVMIWDARKWKDSRGVSSPVATIASEMAGVRKLKFSPVGSGKRVLIAAEPADFVSVIDAATFKTKQTLSFFGEIGGVDFTNNGHDLIIANCDSMRGGIMEFERCDFGGQAFDGFEQYETGNTNQTIKPAVQRYDWMDNGDIATHPKSRGSQTFWKRKLAMSTTPLDLY